MTTANILKLDAETITEVHLTQANLLNIGQAQRMGNPADLHIAAAPVAPHTENPVETMANVLKLDPETITVVNLTRGNLHSIGQAQRMGNLAGLHAENPAATTANGHKLDPETSIVEVTVVLPDTQDLVDSTANLRTLDPVVSIVADQAVLPDTQDLVVSRANLRTQDLVVSIVADQAVLHGTQGPADSKGNLNKLDPAVSIVAEAVLHNMRDRIAKGVASTAQNVDSLRK